MKRLISLVLILCLMSSVCVPVAFADNGVGFVYSTDFENYTSLAAGVAPDSNWSYVNSGNHKYFKSYTEADGNNCMELEWYSEPMLFFGQMFTTGRMHISVNVKTMGNKLYIKAHGSESPGDDTSVNSKYETNSSKYILFSEDGKVQYYTPPISSWTLVDTGATFNTNEWTRLDILTSDLSGETITADYYVNKVKVASQVDITETKSIKGIFFKHETKNGTGAYIDNVYVERFFGDRSLTGMISPRLVDADNAHLSVMLSEPVDKNLLTSQNITIKNVATNQTVKNFEVTDVTDSTFKITIGEKLEYETRYSLTLASSIKGSISQSSMKTPISFITDAENALFYDGFEADAISSSWSTGTICDDGYVGKGMLISGTNSKITVSAAMDSAAEDSAEIEFYVKPSVGFTVCANVDGTSRPLAKWNKSTIDIFTDGTATEATDAVIETNVWSRLRVRIDKEQNKIWVLTNNDKVSKDYTDEIGSINGISFVFEKSWNNCYIDEVYVRNLSTQSYTSFRADYSSGITKGAVFQGGTVAGEKLQLISSVKDESTGAYYVTPSNGTLKIDIDVDFEIDRLARQNLLLTINYIDDDYGWFFVEYPTESGLKTTETVNLLGSGEAKTYSFVIADGLFNTGEYGSDLWIKTTVEKSSGSYASSKRTYSRYPVAITSILGVATEDCSPFEINVSSENTGNIFFDNEAAEFEIELENLTQQDVYADVTYGVYRYTMDVDMEAELVTERTESYAAAANGSISEGFSYIPDQYGLYMLKVEVSGNGISQSKEIPFSKSVGNDEVNYTVGTTTHLAIDGDVDKGMELLSKAGMGLVRGDFNWYDYEKGTQGNYALTDNHTEFLTAAEKYGIKTLAIIGGNNPLYNGAYRGFVPEDNLTDFQNYIKNLVNEPLFKNVSMIEIMNEPDLLSTIANTTITSSDPENDSRAYAEKGAIYAKNIKAAYETIKSERNDINVGIFAISGSCSTSGKAFADHTLNNLGSGRQYDAASIHPYLSGRDAEPGHAGESTKQGHDSLAHTINYYRALANGGRITLEDGGNTANVKGSATGNIYNFETNGEVWITEIGGSAARLPNDTMCSGSEYQQAIENISIYSVIKENSLTDKVWFYELADAALIRDGNYADDGLRITEREMNYGMLHSSTYSVPYAAKQVYLAMSAVNRLTAGAQTCEEIYYSTQDEPSIWNGRKPKTYAFVTKYTCPDRTVYMLRCTASEAANINLTLGSDYTCYDMFGNIVPESSLKKDGKWNVTQEPYYIVEGKTLNEDGFAPEAKIYAGVNQIRLDSDRVGNSVNITIGFKGFETGSAYTMFVAEYDEHSMTNLQAVEVTVPENGIYETDVNITEDKGKTKVFLFDSDGSIRPLCEEKVLNIGS